MRESEKNELIERLGRIDEAICTAKYAIQHGEEPNSIQDAMFQFGVAKAFIIRLREDIRNTEADPDEDSTELPPNGTMSGLFVGTAGWKAAQEPSEYVSVTVAAEQKAEDTEDVILPKEEEKAVSTGARIIVSNLPEVSTLPPTKEVHAPDEELPKPRRRGGRPKKKFTLDEDLPDPLE